MISANEALQRLREGNARFVGGERQIDLLSQPSRRRELAGGQKPFAIVLGCSDSRVPVELVFDQGLGDLFVIRVAGNVVVPSGVGSAEFAAEQFGVRLIVVLGHQSCGAVSATLKELHSPSDALSPGLSSITDRIGPAIADLAAQPLTDALLAEAVHANVMSAVGQMTASSDYLQDLVDAGEMLVIGAEYDFESGVVTFHDGSR